LEWLAAPPGGSWLDVGCGTGALTRLIIEKYMPNEITGIDQSAGFIAHVQNSIIDPRAHFKVGLAQSLDVDSNSIDTVVSGLVINFVPQPGEAILEMLRVTKPGGRIGIFVWDYAAGMKMLRYFWDAALEVDPGAVEHDEGLRFPICREGQLEAAARAAGLKQVEAAPIGVETVFQNFDDYWQPFLGKVGAPPSYLAALEPEASQRIADRLREMLPYDEQGTIRLPARAWTVKGTA